MWKLLIYIFILIWAIFSFPSSIKKYKKYHGKSDLMEIIARVILVPSGVILIIAWFIG
ncbi:MAG: hypothetical protein J1E62_00120 [Lachnospiraceae bacterium]|nr:hypothetical protein [Lachnospiraceae bacterium]